MKKLLILGASFLQLPAIVEAKKMNCFVAVADQYENAPGIEYADEFVKISTIDTDKIIEYAQKFKPDGILTVATDMPMRTVAAVADKFNLPAISKDTAFKATDKGAMIEAFKAAGVAHPEFVIADSVEELLNGIKDFDFPIIVKPVDSSGSRGVTLCKNIKEVENAASYSKNFSRSGRIIAEEYLSGSEVSVEILVVDGETHVIAVTDKITTGAPHFVEMAHCQPSRHKESDIEKIKELAVSATKAIGIELGAAHAEIMLTKNGPKMIEIGARLGGDCITSHLVPLSCGVNMVQAVIKIALGEKPEIKALYHKGSAIKFLDAPIGKIEKIENVPKVDKEKGIVNITFTKAVSDISGEITGSGDRIGYVIGTADTADEALLLCTNAAKEINIVVHK